MPSLLSEPTLVAIYHTAVHLNPEVGDNGLGIGSVEQKAHGYRVSTMGDRTG